MPPLLLTIALSVLICDYSSAFFTPKSYGNTTDWHKIEDCPFLPPSSKALFSERIVVRSNDTVFYVRMVHNFESEQVNVTFESGDYVPCSFPMYVTDFFHTFGELLEASGLGNGQIVVNTVTIGKHRKWTISDFMIVEPRNCTVIHRFTLDFAGSGGVSNYIAYENTFDILIVKYDPDYHATIYRYVGKDDPVVEVGHFPGDLTDVLFKFIHPVKSFDPSAGFLYIRVMHKRDRIVDHLDAEYRSVKRMNLSEVLHTTVKITRESLRKTALSNGTYSLCQYKAQNLSCWLVDPTTLALKGTFEQSHVDSQQLLGHATVANLAGGGILVAATVDKVRDRKPILLQLINERLEPSSFQVLGEVPIRGIMHLSHIGGRNYCLSFVCYDKKSTVYTKCFEIQNQTVV